MALSTPTFPERLLCQVGELVYHESLFGSCVARHYSPLEAIPIDGVGSVELVVWPPEVGIPDATRASAYIDSIWTAILARRTSILCDSIGMMTEIVADWWGYSEDCPRDRVPESLSRAKLYQIGINLDGRHELRLRGDDVVSDRDIVISLSGALAPMRAQLDG